MGVVYRQSELNKMPKGAGFDNSYWQYFLVLERDFEKSLQYVHLDKDNLRTYSLEFAKQLIIISTEFETIAQLLCNNIDDSKVGNIAQYKQIILKEYPNIWSTPVYIDSYNQMEIYPLKSWKDKGGKLSWWDAYNNVKHQRHKLFIEANLKNVLYALGSLIIIESYLYKTVYGEKHGIRYGTSLLRIPGLAESIYYPKGKLPDF